MIKGNKVGSTTLEHMMRVHELQLGHMTISFPDPIELPAGKYDIYLTGINKVNFVRIDEDQQHNRLRLLR
jgi:hypothetical protein